MAELLSAEDRDYLKQEFTRLDRDVPITVVTHESSLVVPGHEVPYGREMKLLMQELAALSERIKLQVEDVAPSDGERLKALGVERLPAILFGGQPGSRMRFYGLPAGYEFSTMVATILELGTGEEPLEEATRQQLGTLKRDVHIQVFVTPT
jgi:alkyl hydroperoxide reductase subunit AhpF